MRKENKEKIRDTIIGAVAAWLVCVLATAAIMALAGVAPSIRIGTAVFIGATLLRIVVR